MQSEIPPKAAVTVEIEASPDDVWQALTTDDGLASWIGEGSTIGEGPGDELYVHDIVTGENKSGYLDEVTPGRRLGYTWWPENDPDYATRVAISLEPCRTGTRVTVIETPLTLTSAALTSASLASGAAWVWRTALLSVIVSAMVTTTATVC